MLNWLPSVWFLGLYQDLAGRPTPVIHTLAVRALTAFFAAGGASLALYLASYRRCVRRIRDSEEPAAKEPGRLQTLVVRWFDQCFLSRPFDRSCFHFATSTLCRNRRHRLVMAGFAGLGIAIALQDAAAGGNAAKHAFGALPTATLLTVPLAILFFLLTGLRFLFDLPADLPANWVFQMAVKQGPDASRRVARKLMLLWIVPVATACLAIYSAVWGVRTGLAEAAFVLLASLALAEILLVDYVKIPFTSSYAGPKYNYGATLIAYLPAFFLFSSGFAGIEHGNLVSISPLPFLALLLLGAASYLEIRRTICYKTRVIPFRISFKPGISLYEQVVYAAKKAVVSGQLRAGDPFPSVRELSKALKINPNTAHKVVTRLVAEGVLQVHPGIGTVVAEQPRPSAGERGNLLHVELEELVVEGKRLGLSLNDMITAVVEHWKRLEGAAYEQHPKSKRSLKAVSQGRRS